MKFLALLPSDDLSLGSEKFQSYVLIEDAKFSQMFYSLSYDLDSLCFTKYSGRESRSWGSQLREKITKFNEENSSCLVGNSTFFLIKVDNKYLVICIPLGENYKGQQLVFCNFNLCDCDTFPAHYHHRLIVPKLD